MSYISKILKSNLFILSTDTVPGIGGILNDKVLKKINDVKKIYEFKKYAILVANINQARKFSEWNIDAEILAKKYWPGALSIALETYALRMPNSSKIIKLLEKIGPIYLSSANFHNENPLSFEEAKIVFANKIDIFLDLTNTSSHLSSTVIKASTKEILREGSVKIT